MPAVFRKNASHTDKILDDAKCATSHGGQLLVDALAKDFGLWEKLAACPLIDPRKDKSLGFSPEAIIAQIVFTLCSGGTSLSDAGRMGADPTLGKLLGMDRWAEETTIGNWLRAQTVHSLRAFWGVVLEFVAWALKKSNPARVRRNGKLEVVFDDTQIEVEGRYFEGVGANYNGERSYSWQTLWVGPFVADMEWGAGNRDPSGCLECELVTTVGLWEEAASKGEAHFYADSTSSAGKFLNLFDQRGWDWSVSYNKWTSKLDTIAAQMKEEEWSAPEEGVDRRGEPILQQYGWIKHLPGEECQRVQTFAVIRFKARDGGELMWRYAYVVGGGKIQREQLHHPAAAREVFQTHRLKGAKEQGFHQLLGDRDLHHPPCLDSDANAFFYAIGALSYNLLMAVRVLLLDDEYQTWGVRRLIRYWLTVPVKVSNHAGRQRARIFVPRSAMRWWRLFLDHHYPKRKRGRPPSRHGPLEMQAVRA